MKLIERLIPEQATFHFCLCLQIYSFWFFHTHFIFLNHQQTIHSKSTSLSDIFKILLTNFSGVKCLFLFTVERVSWLIQRRNTRGRTHSIDIETESGGKSTRVMIFCFGENWISINNNNNNTKSNNNNLFHYCCGSCSTLNASKAYTYILGHMYWYNFSSLRLKILLCFELKQSFVCFSFIPLYFYYVLVLII